MKKLLAGLTKVAAGAAVAGVGVLTYRVYKEKLDEAYLEGFSDGVNDEEYEEDEVGYEDEEYDNEDCGTCNCDCGCEDEDQLDKINDCMENSEKFKEAKQRTDEIVEQLKEVISSGADELKKVLEEITGDKLSEEDLKDALKTIIDESELVKDQVMSSDVLEKLENITKETIEQFKNFSNEWREKVSKPLSEEEAAELSRKSKGILKGNEEGKAYVDWSEFESKAYTGLGKVLNKAQDMVNKRIDK